MESIIVRLRDPDKDVYTFCKENDFLDVYEDWLYKTGVEIPDTLKLYARLKVGDK